MPDAARPRVDEHGLARCRPTGAQRPQRHRTGHRQHAGRAEVEPVGNGRKPLGVGDDVVGEGVLGDQGGHPPPHQLGVDRRSDGLDGPHHVTGELPRQRAVEDRRHGRAPADHGVDEVGPDPLGADQHLSGPRGGDIGILQLQDFWAAVLVIANASHGDSLVRMERRICCGSRED